MDLEQESERKRDEKGKFYEVRDERTKKGWKRKAEYLLLVQTDNDHAREEIQ
jgi:hypothetical protein